MRGVPVLAPILASALALACAGQALAAPLTEATVRAFVAGQERAWNAQDLKTYFAGFTPDAAFVDQALSSQNRIVPYGRSSLEEARRQTLRVARTARLHEDGMIQSVQLSPDRRSAVVQSQVTARVSGAGGVRLSCVRREQTVALAGARLLSRGQTDTVVRCRR